MLKIRYSLFSCFSFFIAVASLHSQDLNYVRQVVDTLGSPTMAGRGYVERGDLKAAIYIANQFHDIGLLSFRKGYFQGYHFPINTFPGNAILQVGDSILEPGRDFLVAAKSKSIRGQYELVWMNDTNLTINQIEEKTKGMDLRKKILVLEKSSELIRLKELKDVLGVLLLRDGKLTWSVSGAAKPGKMVAIEIHRDKIKEGTQTITLNIDTKFFKKYQTQNVIGYIKGTEQPDSFLVFTAHYDHLGKLGHKTWFPGANDNASGTAMLLDLARFYSKQENKPEISMVFMSFSGEEAGLFGSAYYVRHPFFPLKKIKFLVNLDMVGTGSDGIGVVNGTKFELEIGRLQEINEQKKYLKEIKKRGESAHSDHHPFYKKGVKAVFIYTFGDDYKDYHNIYDIPSKLPLTGYYNLFNLLTDFMKTF